MEVNEELIRHVAKLARLKLNEKEVEQFKEDLASILDLFSKIDELKIEEDFVLQPVEPKSNLREDKVEESLSKEKKFRNTEHEENNFFKGPKIK